MTWLLSIAITCGVTAALMGNRTAWALLASLGFCLWYNTPGTEAVPLLLMLIDSFTILAIILLHWTRPIARETIGVLLLFLPAWLFYVLPDPWCFYGGATVVITQLLLTFPRKDFIAGVCTIELQRERWDEFDLRVRI